MQNNTEVKFESLEATRGLAALIVVIHHSHFLYGKPSLFIDNGALFVDYFFILSGFIMATAYQHKIGNSINFKSFFLLRFGRLFPLHLFMLFMWIPFIAIKFLAYKNGIGGSNPLITCNVETFFSNLLLIHSLGIYSFESWNFPSWSISVEFYSYLVFFIYVLIMRNKRFIVIPLLISFLNYCFLCYLFPHGELTRTYDFGMIRCLGGFFAGVALFGIYKKKKIMFNGLLISSIIEFLCILLIVIFVSESYHSLTNEFFTFLSFMFTLYIFSSQEKGLISKMLKSPPLQMIGKLSYSIYMVHAIVVVGLQNVFERLFGFNVTDIVMHKGEHLKVIITKWAYLLDFSEITVVIMISYLTYKFIELPWRNKFRMYARTN